MEEIKVSLSLEDYFPKYSVEVVPGLTVHYGKRPNWFRRLMYRLLLGVVWVENK